MGRRRAARPLLLVLLLLVLLLVLLLLVLLLRGVLLLLLVLAPLLRGVLLLQWSVGRHLLERSRRARPPPTRLFGLLCPAWARLWLPQWATRAARLQRRAAAARDLIGGQLPHRWLRLLAPAHDGIAMCFPHGRYAPPPLRPGRAPPPAAAPRPIRPRPPRLRWHLLREHPSRRAGSARRADAAAAP
jgi:hypothetical protein